MLLALTCEILKLMCGPGFGCMSPQHASMIDIHNNMNAVYSESKQNILKILGILSLNKFRLGLPLVTLSVAGNRQVNVSRCLPSLSRITPGLQRVTLSVVEYRQVRRYRHINVVKYDVLMFLYRILRDSRNKNMKYNCMFVNEEYLLTVRTYLQRMKSPIRARQTATSIIGW